MDVSLLREKELHPKVIGPAELPGYQIVIGNRATLISSRESTSYGMLIDLPEAEATALYSAPDVSDYRPEKINALLLSDRTIHPSVCYNLPANALGAGINSEYARKLSALVLKLDFPPPYACEIIKSRDA